MRVGGGTSPVTLVSEVDLHGERSKRVLGILATCNDTANSCWNLQGDLCMIAAKVFPDWTNAQQEELVHNQFIQGVASPTV